MTAPFTAGQQVAIVVPVEYSAGYEHMTAYAGCVGSVAKLGYRMMTETADRWTYLKVTKYRQYENVTIVFDAPPVGGESRYTFPLAWVTSAPIAPAADQILAMCDAAPSLSIVLPDNANNPDGDRWAVYHAGMLVSAYLTRAAADAMIADYAAGRTYYCAACHATYPESFACLCRRDPAMAAKVAARIASLTPPATLDLPTTTEEIEAMEAAQAANLTPAQRHPRAAAVLGLASQVAAQPSYWDDADKATNDNPAALAELAAVLEHPALALTSADIRAAAPDEDWRMAAIVMRDSLTVIGRLDPLRSLYTVRNHWLAAWAAAHRLIATDPDRALATKGGAPRALACVACGELRSDLAAYDHTNGAIVALCPLCIDAARHYAYRTEIPEHMQRLYRLTADECPAVKPCSDCGAFLPALRISPNQCQRCHDGDTRFYRSDYGRPMSAKEYDAAQVEAARAEARHEAEQVTAETAYRRAVLDEDGDAVPADSSYALAWAAVADGIAVNEADPAGDEPADADHPVNPGAPIAIHITEAQANAPAYAIATRMLALPADLYHADTSHPRRLTVSSAVIALLTDARERFNADTTDDNDLRLMLWNLADCAAAERTGRPDDARRHWKAARATAERLGDSPELIAARAHAQREANATGRDMTLYRARNTGHYVTVPQGEHEQARAQFGPLLQTLEAFGPAPAGWQTAGEMPTEATPDPLAAMPASYFRRINEQNCETIQDLERQRRDDRAILVKLAAMLEDAADKLPDTTEANDQRAELYPIADAIRLVADAVTTYDPEAAEALICRL